MPHTYRTALTLLLMTAGGSARAQELGGCPMLPKNNIWNTAVDNLPVHAGSARYIESEGADANLHPDFSAGGGIPYAVVPREQPMVKIDFGGNAESDPGPYPIPNDVPVEAGEDNHALILQQGLCRLYEVFLLKRKPDGTWSGGSGASYDLRSNALRPDGWTSADAAGLPMLPGLVRWDEIEAGEIKHAIRMTVPRTRREYVWPARHFASRSDDVNLPPMGQRFRLKAGYDISGFDPKVQVLLRALKKYGMILADNGQPWFLTGSTNRNWNDELWAQIKRIKGRDLEAVDASSLMIGPNSGQAGVLTTVSRQDVSFTPTPVFDPQGGSTISLKLTGNVTSSSLVNLLDGQQVGFLICQDETGGHDFQWPSNVAGGMRISAAAKTCSAQQFVSDGKGLYATTPGVTDLPLIE